LKTLIKYKKKGYFFMKTLSIREYKILISKAKNLNDKIKDNSITNTDVLDLTQFILETVPDNFDEHVITVEQASNMFREYLSKIFPNPEHRVLTHYWDRDDSFSSKELESIMESAIENESDNFEYEADDYLLFDDNIYNDVVSGDIDNIINDFYIQNKHSDEIKELDKSNYIDLLDIFGDMISYDINAAQLLDHSRFEDLTVHFPEDESITDTSIYDNFVKIFDTPKFLEVPRVTTLDWLLNTQDYTREDLQSEDKRNKSVFLKTLYEELFNYISSDAIAYFHLIALPESNDFNAILSLATKREVILKKNTPFGLFDPFNGSGSGLGIELEKNILMNETTLKDYDTYLTYSYSNTFGNYSPISVYGYDVRNKNINTLELPKSE
jgi:hypothetical protein